MLHVVHVRPAVLSALFTTRRSHLMHQIRAMRMAPSLGTRCHTHGGPGHHGRARSKPLLRVHEIAGQRWHMHASGCLKPPRLFTRPMHHDYMHDFTRGLKLARLILHAAMARQATTNCAQRRQRHRFMFVVRGSGGATCSPDCVLAPPAPRMICMNCSRSLPAVAWPV